MTVARGYRLLLATKCSVLQQKADVIKSLFVFNGADGFSNLWAVKDAGFSALGVLSEAGCTTPSQPYNEISPKGLLTLHHRREPRLFTVGVPLGTPPRNKTLTMDASLTGRVTVFNWRGINCARPQ